NVGHEPVDAHAPLLFARPLELHLKARRSVGRQGPRGMELDVAKAPPPAAARFPRGGKRRFAIGCRRKQHRTPHQMVGHVWETGWRERRLPTSHRLGSQLEPPLEQLLMTAMHHVAASCALGQVGIGVTEVLHQLSIYPLTVTGGAL